MSDYAGPPQRDIVEVLRECARLIDSGQADHMNMLWVYRAADEIEHLREELAAEREACAKIADDLKEWARDTEWDVGVEHAKQAIAAAIRSRKTEPTP